MPERARLKVHGQGDVEVELIAAYLADLRRVYESVLVLESAIDGLDRAVHEYRLLIPFELSFAWPLSSRRGLRRMPEWPPTAEQIASFVPRSERLVLSSVKLTSPGFWEFMGSLNPLEVLRRYLNDRHERRQDRAYRESAERRRLELQNAILENEAFGGRLKILKENGMTERDLAPLLNELAYRPLSGLDRYQDTGVIEQVEISRVDEKK